MKPDFLRICFLTAAPRKLQTISETFLMTETFTGSSSYTHSLDKEQDEGKAFLSMETIKIFSLHSRLSSHKTCRKRRILKPFLLPL